MMGKSLLSTTKLVFAMLHKIVELHEAGVGQEIVDDIHNVVNHVKEVIDDHHGTHVN